MKALEEEVEVVGVDLSRMTEALTHPPVVTKEPVGYVVETSLIGY